jgi:protein SCO1/2
MGISDLELSAPARRAFLCGAAAVLLGTFTTAARAHNEAGAVDPPLPPPDVPLTLQDGSSAGLRAALAGKVTALQLIFTSCRATCPIQGALFAKGARQLGDSLPAAQWLSISIDPARDDPAALRRWLARFGAHPRWRAGRPAAEELKALVGFLKSKKPGADPHTAQVYFFNVKGELVMRSVDFPPVPEMIRIMKSVARSI